MTRIGMATEYGPEKIPRHVAAKWSCPLVVAHQIDGGAPRTRRRSQVQASQLFQDGPVEFDLGQVAPFTVRAPSAVTA